MKKVKPLRNNNELDFVVTLVSRNAVSFEMVIEGDLIFKEFCI